MRQCHGLQIDDGIGGSHIVVARLPDASRVDDQPVEVE